MLADVRAILNLCQSNGIRIVLFINPVHADNLEILALSGRWNNFEDWKRELVALTEQYLEPNGRTPIALWDFTGYGPYSTETVFVGHIPRWFLDSAHYTRALGDAMINRIVGAGDARFGVLLGSSTLVSHLAATREQQRLYREHHPEALRRLRYLYTAAGVHPQAAQ